MTDLRRPLILLLMLTLAACSVSPPAPVQESADRASDPTTASADTSAAERDVAQPAVERAPAPGRPVEVLKSPNDPRAYRYLTLENGLQVLLVSDPQTDKAAASLVVFRGSYHEPAQFPGLAHFLEHMLFIGTEKYPEVDAYQAFISRHGGSSNAYTAGDHTNYFFDIQPDEFQAAMDRFAQFFISPLFAADYVDREKNAVHSEYQMQLKADNWRAAAVMGEAMNPAHPEARFSIGNLETLHDGVQAALVEFFRTEYSADQMVLVALSNESLDELADWIRPMFSAIEDRRLGPAPIEEPLFLDSQLPATVRYRTIKDGYRATYNFPVPAIEQFYRQKPAEYVSNLIGHEGQGSLYQRLQREGWIESLSAGTGSFDERNSLLVVDIQLTDAGYRNIEQVSDSVYDYLDLLRQSPPEAWRYQEQARIAELGFRFQEQSSATSFVYQVGPRFLRYPPRDVLAAPYLMSDFDPGLIERYLGALRPDNVVMELAGPDVPVSEMEPWFKVPYDIEPGAPARTEVAADGLALPPPNPYLPQNLDVLPDEPEPPRLAAARPGLTLWSDRDTEFGTPRSNLYLSLGVPDGIQTPEDLAAASLYVRIVRDALSEAVYPAYLAGLGYGLDVDGYGFQVAIYGYSDKQLTLLATVLNALTDTVIDPARFAVLRDELLRDWRNYRDERPYTQALGALNYLLLSSRWPPELLEQALADRTVDDLAAWVRERAGKFHVLGLNQGNVPVESAWALGAVIQEQLTLGAFPRQAPAVMKVTAARRYQLDIDHQDATVVLYLQDPDGSVESRARSALAVSMLSQTYFTQLRTERQLGYVVAMTNQTLRDTGSLAFIVQSPVASAAELERATQAFLTAQVDAVRAMPDAAFESYKLGLITRLTERDKNLAERGRRLWNDLDLGITSFDSRQQVAEAVEALTRPQMVEFLSAAAASFESRRLAVYSDGQFTESPSVGEPLRSVEQFKAQVESADLVPVQGGG
ncbi:MAG: insulinase family protein [Pseudomonadales bacterium]